MCYLLLKRMFYWLMFFSIVIVSYTGPGICAELRDYDLPSEKYLPYRQDQQQMQQQMSAPPDEEAEIDRDFYDEIINLTSQERQALRKELEKQIKSSLDKKDFLSVEHYTRLLNTLDRYQEP